MQYASKLEQNKEPRSSFNLEARAQFPVTSLYDPDTMPPVLVKVHQALDKAVDLSFRPQLFYK